MTSVLDTIRSLPDQSSWSQDVKHLARNVTAAIESRLRWQLKADSQRPFRLPDPFVQGAMDMLHQGDAIRVSRINRYALVQFRPTVHFRACTLGFHSDAKKQGPLVHELAHLATMNRPCEHVACVESMQGDRKVDDGVLSILLACTRGARMESLALTDRFAMTTENLRMVPRLTELGCFSLPPADALTSLSGLEKLDLVSSVATTDFVRACITDDVWREQVAPRLKSLYVDWSTRIAPEEGKRMFASVCNLTSLAVDTSTDTSMRLALRAIPAGRLRALSLSTFGNYLTDRNTDLSELPRIGSALKSLYLPLAGLSVAQVDAIAKACPRVVCFAADVASGAAAPEQYLRAVMPWNEQLEELSLDVPAPSDDNDTGVSIADVASWTSRFRKLRHPLLVFRRRTMIVTSKRDLDTLTNALQTFARSPRPWFANERAYFGLNADKSHRFVVRVASSRLERAMAQFVTRMAAMSHWNFSLLCDKMGDEFFGSVRLGGAFLAFEAALKPTTATLLSAFKRRQATERSRLTILQLKSSTPWLHDIDLPAVVSTALASNVCKILLQDLAFDATTDFCIDMVRAVQECAKQEPQRACSVHLYCSEESSASKIQVWEATGTRNVTQDAGVYFSLWNYGGKATLSFGYGK